MISICLFVVSLYITLALAAFNNRRKFKKMLEEEMQKSIKKSIKNNIDFNNRYIEKINNKSDDIINSCEKLLNRN